MPDIASLYDALGGDEPLTAAVERLYDKIIRDPELAPFFEGVVLARHTVHFRAFLRGALGGPDTYRGPAIDRAHAHLGLTDHHFDLVAGHLVAVLGELEVPADVADGLLGAVAPLRGIVVSAPVPTGPDTAATVRT